MYDSRIVDAFQWVPTSIRGGEVAGRRKHQIEAASAAKPPFPS